MRILPCPAGPPRPGEVFFSLRCPALRRGESLLLTPEPLPAFPMAQALLPREYFLPEAGQSRLAAGVSLLSCAGAPVFSVLCLCRLPVPGRLYSLPCVWLSALEDTREEELRLCLRRNGPALAWITVSDKGARGERRDDSGPAIEEMLLEALPLRCVSGHMIPDDLPALRALAADMLLTQGYDLLAVSGGTGLGPRDVTPEALLPLLDKRLPGFEQAMLAASLQSTPRGAISRAVCGVAGQGIIITLPGSPKAVRENLRPLLPALGHALDKLQGSPADCGAS